MLRHPPNDRSISARRRHILPSLLLFCLLTLGYLSPTPVFAQDGVTVHIVVPGEYLSFIARRYNVSVSQLMTYNNIRDADLIRPGQQILIPSVAAPLPTNTPLPASNPAVQPTPSTEEPSGVPIGAPATAPTRTPLPTASIPDGYTSRGEPVYTVRRGDTLYGISTRFGVSSGSIVARNSLRSSVIIVGQRLIIPIGGVQDQPAFRPQTPTANETIPEVRSAATPTAVVEPGLFLLPTAPPTQPSGARYR